MSVKIWDREPGRQCFFEEANKMNKVLRPKRDRCSCPLRQPVETVWEMRRKNDAFCNQGSDVFLYASSPRRFRTENLGGVVFQ